jgi:hypothetical protein
MSPQVRLRRGRNIYGTSVQTIFGLVGTVVGLADQTATLGD